MTQLSEYDRLKIALHKVVRKVMGSDIIHRVDYLAAYPCMVVSQNSDGSLELRPDHPSLPDFPSVPIRYGIPGIVAQVASGSRVILEFTHGDPQFPIATVWDSSSVTSISLTASSIQLGSSTSSQPFILGTNFATHMAQLAAAATALSGALTPSLLPPSAAAASAAAASIAAAATALAGDLSTVVKGQ